MLKNYLKIAVAVLLRRKFFTFISLFGISFTLAILIITTAFLDHLSNNTYPETNRDKSLYVQMLSQRNPKTGSQMTGPLSLNYIEKYIMPMKSITKVGFSSIFQSTNSYINNKKLVLNLKYTNDQFWETLNFHFVEGKPYNQQQIQRGERIAVISEETRDAYFGSSATVTGKFIETDNVQYRISGVVKNVPVTLLNSSADIYVPYTVSKTELRDNQLAGRFMAILLANDNSDLEKVRKEYASVVSKIPPQDKDRPEIISSADSYLSTFTRQVLGNSGNDGMSRFVLAVGIFMLFFMLLPTLNLVNINISRIMERSSEIGVRKAFGASSGVLVYQFIIENILLTLIGTIVGIGLSLLVMMLINQSGIIPNLILSINFNVTIYALLLCLVFGLLSGVYPAWRMSRLQVVNALKAN